MVARTKRQQPQQQPDSLAEWLEAELRETKARLHKVESELDQTLKHGWSLEADVRKINEALNTSGSAVNQISAMREQLRQVHDLVSRVQDRQQAITNKTEEVLRQRQSDTGKDKQHLGDIGKQVDAFTRMLDQYEARLQHIEDAVRKAEEHITAARVSNQSLARELDDVAGRGNRSLEAAIRLEQDVSRHAGDLDTLRKADETLDDKILLLLEQSRRFNERLDKVEDVASFPEEARELLHRANAEREQLTHRLAIMEKLTTEFSERLQRFGTELAKVEQRQEVESAQIMDLTGRVQETTEVLESQMKRLRQLLHRHRRRQMDTLAQEIKELGHGDLQGQQ